MLLLKPLILMHSCITCSYSNHSFLCTLVLHALTQTTHSCALLYYTLLLKPLILVHSCITRSYSNHSFLCTLVLHALTQTTHSYALLYYIILGVMQWSMKVNTNLLHSDTNVLYSKRARQWTVSESKFQTITAVGWFFFFTSNMTCYHGNHLLRNGHNYH